MEATSPPGDLATDNIDFYSRPDSSERFLIDEKKFTPFGRVKFGLVHLGVVPRPEVPPPTRIDRLKLITRRAIQLFAQWNDTQEYPLRWPKPRQR